MEWLFVILFAGVTLALLGGSFRALVKARTIEDVPTSKIRSAPQGYVELSGTASLDEGTELLFSPLTMTPCLWYHYKIERYQRRGKSSHWSTVEQGTSERPFLLSDNTGRCLIDPRHADVTTNNRRRWRGHHRRPLGGPGKSSSSLLSGGKYRYSEQSIAPEQWLYAIGQFTSHHPDSPEQQARARAGALLREWKQDRASLIRRFDTDGDGEVDLAEWEQAQQAAAREARAAVTTDYDHQTTDVLSRPDNGRPYLLSTKDAKLLTGHYRRQALLLLAAFALFATATVYQIYAIV